jgi:hypothetical protein
MSGHRTTHRCREVVWPGPVRSGKQRPSQSIRRYCTSPPFSPWWFPGGWVVLYRIASWYRPQVAFWRPCRVVAVEVGDGETSKPPKPPGWCLLLLPVSLAVPQIKTWKQATMTTFRPCRCKDGYQLSAKPCARRMQSHGHNLTETADMFFILESPHRCGVCLPPASSPVCPVCPVSVQCFQVTPTPMSGTANLTQSGNGRETSLHLDFWTCSSKAATPLLRPPSFPQTTRSLTNNPK